MLKIRKSDISEIQSEVDKNGSDESNSSDESYGSDESNSSDEGDN